MSMIKALGTDWVITELPQEKLIKNCDKNINLCIFSESIPTVYWNIPYYFKNTYLQATFRTYFSKNEFSHPFKHLLCIPTRT